MEIVLAFLGILLMREIPAVIKEIEKRDAKAKDRPI